MSVCPLCVDKEGRPRRGRRECPRCGGFGEVNTFRAGAAACVRAAVAVFDVAGTLIFALCMLAVGLAAGPLLLLASGWEVLKGLHAWAVGDAISGDMEVAWIIFGVSCAGVVVWASAAFIYYGSR